MSKLSSAVFLLLCVGAPACGFPKTSSAPGPLSASASAGAISRFPGTTAESLSAGHDGFIAKCNGCHGYPELAAIPDDRWPSILQKMGPKSHLDAKQSEDILHFVLAARTEAPKAQ